MRASIERGTSVEPQTEEHWARRIIRRSIRPFTGLERHEIVTVITETFSEWADDRAPRLGASLAFYTLLSAAPLLLVVVAVAALAYGQDAARGQLVWEIRGVVGAERAEVIQDLIQNAYKPGSGVIATVLGILTLVLGGTSVVVELRDALNTIWHVPQAERSLCVAGMVRLAKERLASFVLILAGGFLLLVSVTLNAGIAAVGEFLGSYLRAREFMLQASAFVISFLVFAFLFAAIFKILPDVALTWGDVMVGACVTAFLFEIGKQLIGLYLGRTSFASAYGAAGSLVMLLVWLYYSAQVFFLGAEFTKVYTRTRIATGKRAPAEPGADESAVI